MSSPVEIKQQQINSLFQHNPNVSVLVDGQMYEVPCAVPDSTSTLLVNLPPEFPNLPPVITVTPTGLRHPWIESDVISHDAGWQTNLGKLVQDIREEFARRPPARKTIASNNISHDQIEEGYGNRPPPPVPTTATPFLPQPSIPPALALTSAEHNFINTKSLEELEELLKDDTAFELFFNSLERVQGMKTVREELRSGNENLAHKNLAKEDELAKLRDQVKELNEKYIELRTNFEEKERQQQEAFSRFSSSTVLTRLKASVYESDELSESVAQSFMDGNLEHDIFVKQFRELRKVYHLRASKLERAQKESLFLTPK